MRARVRLPGGHSSAGVSIVIALEWICFVEFVLVYVSYLNPVWQRARSFTACTAFLPRARWTCVRRHLLHAPIIYGHTPFGRSVRVRVWVIDRANPGQFVRPPTLSDSNARAHLTYLYCYYNSISALSKHQRIRSVLACMHARTHARDRRAARAESHHRALLCARARAVASRLA